MASVLLKLDVLFTLFTAFIDSSFRKGARRAMKFMPGDRAVIERWTVQEGLSIGGNMERVGLSFEDTLAVDYQRSLLPFNDSRVWFLLPLQVLLMGSWHVFIPAQTYWGDIEYRTCLWMYGIFDHS